jgi:hypothetical protein
MSEKDEQRAVVDYCKSIDLFIFAIPSVVFGRKTGGVPIGYKKGMPDLCIPKYNLYIEMKKVKPSKVKAHEEAQEKVHEILRENGCNVYRCFGAEQAIEVVKKYQDLELVEII